MTNNEIFEAIDQLQYVLDKHAKSGVYQFANQDDIKLLEKVYNHITKRQYIKFNAGCSTCIKESFLILNNWKKREMKKMEAEGNAVEFTAEVAEQAIAEPIVEEKKEDVKAIQKPKQNGRSKRK
ncbi:hypothetical protein [Sphingobacterium mizutaii]|uniref:hypothetical protein n=1 Tax=Sphingobacterium mizutaii TaxID=1010 RepID=UPI001629211E|nr:hypothetical protein [Sphingobacterium mizutaii]